MLKLWVHAQVMGAPIAASLLMTDGLLGLRGWQWLFLIEGLPTICAGIWMYLTLAPAPLDASFLTAAERDFVHQRVKSNKVICVRRPARSSSWLLERRQCHRVGILGSSP